eukprot:6194153-Pleurochrysis_carterae.AAC.5
MLPMGYSVKTPGVGYLAIALRVLGLGCLRGVAIAVSQRAKRETLKFITLTFISYILQLYHIQVYMRSRVGRASARDPTAAAAQRSLANTFHSSFSTHPLPE